MKTKILGWIMENNIKTRIKLKGDKIIDHESNFIYLGSTTISDVRWKMKI